MHRITLHGDIFFVYDGSDEKSLYRRTVSSNDTYNEIYWCGKFYHWKSSVRERFDGVMDDFIIWNDVLSESISSLYNQTNQSTLDSKGNNYVYVSDLSLAGPLKTSQTRV